MHTKRAKAIAFTTLFYSVMSIFTNFNDPLTGKA